MVFIEPSFPFLIAKLFFLRHRHGFLSRFNPKALDVFRHHDAEFLGFGFKRQHPFGGPPQPLIVVLEGNLDLVPIDNQAFVGDGFADLGDEAKAPTEVYAQDAIEEAFEHARRERIRQESVDDVAEQGVNPGDIGGADQSPNHGKKRADNPLEIAPAGGIIPKFDFHAVDENEAGNQLNHRHQSTYAKNLNELIEGRIARDIAPGNRI